MRIFDLKRGDLLHSPDTPKCYQLWKVEFDARLKENGWYWIALVDANRNNEPVQGWWATPGEDFDAETLEINRSVWRDGVQISFYEDRRPLFRNLADDLVYQFPNGPPENGNWIPLTAEEKGRVLY